MKRSIEVWQLMGFIFASISGTILHFLYEWLEKTIWIAPFSSVNESTWEHMKLLFWPMLIFAIVQSVFFKEYKNYWCVKFQGILLGLILIPILFYTFNGVIGKSPDWLNITFFFVSVIISYIYETRLFINDKVWCSSTEFAVAVLFVIAIFFIIFTFVPPKIGIFNEPVMRL